MKLIIVLIYSLFSLLDAFGAFNETLTLKQVSEDGNQFVFVRREGAAPWKGITIKDPQTKVILYEARTAKCSATACVGIVVKNHSGLKLRLDEEYAHSYNEVAIQLNGQETPLPEPEVIEPVVVKPEIVKPEVVKPKAKPIPKIIEPPKLASPLDRALYASYGSPIGPGFKIGYFKQRESFWWGINYANIASATSKVSIKGHLFSGAASLTLLKPSPKIDINLIGELGLAKASLDFTAVDPDGPVKDVMSYFWAVAGEGKYNFDQFSLSLKSGVSKAGFASSYDGTFSRFNNPYGTILMFLEIGVYYRF
jgi:hypothetical protein